MSRADLLVISNGHGEDAIGAALVAAVRARLPAMVIQAFPLVGEGAAYSPADVVGPRQTLPAGGLTLHHPALLLQDLRAGIVSLTVRQIGFLRRQRPAAVLVVGDAYAQALAALVGAPRAVLQPLVSVLQERPLAASRLNRYFMESIRAPERFLLARARRVYTRDEPTAASLRSRGVERAVYLGNPIMDGLAAEPLFERVGPDRGVVLALLPGSRAYATTSVSLMITAVFQLTELLGPGTPVTGLVAWTRRDLPPPAPGWALVAASADRTKPPPGSRATDQSQSWPTTAAEWKNGAATIRWERGAFAQVLASADVAVGTAGTANEQAAGLGLPVVAFAVPPFYGSAFLENQVRLLGGALRIVDGRAPVIAAAAADALMDGPHRRAAAQVGPARLGGPGGTVAVADDLVGWFAELGVGRAAAAA
ncbi:MAG TPA: lipid-A-disaccharide synthase-related protein, partial [Trueperaceae bacterium]|nr:lipid-A-disaccharide synthase-related protein [Trueperaceae bacterium]